MMIRKKVFGALVAGLAVGAAWSTSVEGQDPATVTPATKRPYDFEQLLAPPTTTDDYWRVLKRDLEFGLVERARERLEALLKRQDLTPELAVELREKYGDAMMIKLQQTPETSDLAKQLLDLTNKGAQAKARDEKRIRHFIGQLSKSASERSYAVDQLRRIGVHTIPYMIDALRDSETNRALVIQSLFEMNRSCWPAVAATMESGDEELMGLMIDVLRSYAVPQSAEWLWHVAGSEKYSEALRTHAHSTLGFLTATNPGNLPPSAQQLADVAARYDNHKSWLHDLGDQLEVWDWEGDNVTSTTMTITQAEEHLGIKRSLQALELDPENRRAKIALLSLALEKGFEKIGIDQALPGKQGGVRDVVYSSGPEMVEEVLEKAMQARRTGVVVGAVRALGEIGDRSALVNGPLGKALNYPNPRVQTAATFAALSIHPRTNFPQAQRVVQNLIRSLGQDTRPVALVIDSDPLNARTIAQPLSELGYVPRTAATGRLGFTMAAESAAVDLIIVEPKVRDWGLDGTLANLRADARTSGVPIIVLSTPDIEDKVRNLPDRFAGVSVTPTGADAAQLSAVIQLGQDSPMDVPLSDNEKAANQRAALDWTVRLARGELQYLDVTPATKTLLALMGSPETGPQAALALRYLPSPDVQKQLADIVLSDAESMPLRIAASKALAGNIQSSSGALGPVTVGGLRKLFVETSDSELRGALARLVGVVRPTQQQVAAQLRRFQPLTKDDAPADASVANEPTVADPEPKPEEKPEEEPQPKKKAGFFD